MIAMVILMMGQQTYCEELTPLLKIINTETNDPSTLYLKILEKKLSGLKLVTTERTSTYSYKDVENGATLLTKKGVKIITLKGEALNKYNGGAVNLTYLKNFSVFGSSYKTIRLKIERNGEAWGLRLRNSPVEEILLTPHPYGITSHQFK